MVFQILLQSELLITVRAGEWLIVGMSPHVAKQDVAGRVALVAVLMRAPELFFVLGVVIGSGTSQDLLVEG